MGFVKGNTGQQLQPLSRARVWTSGGTTSPLHPRGGTTSPSYPGANVMLPQQPELGRHVLQVHTPRTALQCNVVMPRAPPPAKLCFVNDSSRRRDRPRPASVPISALSQHSNDVTPRVLHPASSSFAVPEYAGSRPRDAVNDLVGKVRLIKARSDGAESAPAPPPAHAMTVTDALCQVRSRLKVREVATAMSKAPTIDELQEESEEAESSPTHPHQTTHQSCLIAPPEEAARMPSRDASLGPHNQVIEHSIWIGASEVRRPSEIQNEHTPSKHSLFLDDFYKWDAMLAKPQSSVVLDDGDDTWTGLAEDTVLDEIPEEPTVKDVRSEADEVISLDEAPFNNAGSSSPDNKARTLPASWLPPMSAQSPREFCPAAWAVKEVSLGTPLEGNTPPESPSVASEVPEAHFPFKKAGCVGGAGPQVQVQFGEEERSSLVSNWLCWCKPLSRDTRKFYSCGTPVISQR